MANPFFERLNNVIKETNERELAHARTQIELLASANSSQKTALNLLPAVLAHLIKLIKSILLLALTLVAYVLTWIPMADSKVSVTRVTLSNDMSIDSTEELRQSTLIKQCLLNETKMILLNIGNAILAIVHPITRLINSRNGYDETNETVDKALVKSTWNFFSPVDQEIYDSMMEKNSKLQTMDQNSYRL